MNEDLAKDGYEEVPFDQPQVYNNYRHYNGIKAMGKGLTLVDLPDGPYNATLYGYECTIYDLLHGNKVVRLDIGLRNIAPSKVKVLIKDKTAYLLYDK